MKLPFLLAGSLAANAALLAAFALKPELAPPAFRDFFARQFFAADVAAPPPAPVHRAPPPREKLWTAFESGDDLGRLLGRLRAAGFPPAIIREIITREINQRYDARQRPFFESDPNTPFWKLKSGNFFVGGDKRLEEYQQLWRERTKTLRDLLNDPFFATDDVTAEQRRRFGDLPRQKIDAIQRVEDDYAEMMSAVRSAMGGVTLPEDRDKLALLAREKRTDLASILSPEELADYELHSSPITSRLRYQLQGFDATEAEFRAIYDANKAVNDKVPGGPQTAMMGDFTQRESLQKELNDRLRASLGDTRYADYIRESNSEFQQLNRLAQTQSLPRDTTLAAFNLRDSVAAESNRIYDDTSLNNDQKRAALTTLAQNTRAQLTTMLGPVAGPAYVKVADAWLGNVESGSAVKFTPSAPLTLVSDGSSITFSSSTGPTSYRRLPSSKPGP